MAIDNAEKRKCIVGIDCGLGVTPNASPDVQWRQEAGHGYCGIAPLTISFDRWKRRRNKLIGSFRRGF